MNTNKSQSFFSIHSCVSKIRREGFVSIPWPQGGSSPADTSRRLGQAGRRGSIIAWVLYLLLASEIPCFAIEASESQFLWNEANSIMASARTPEDYLIAAQAYQNLMDRGIRNGPLCYNLGTALLNAGRYDSAIDAFSRAERYLGSYPDIRRNMKIALARKAKLQGKEIALPWYRFLLFWHFRLSGPTRMAIAVAAFSAFWLALTLKLLGLRKWIKALLILSFLIFVVFGSSVATSWQQETNAKRFSYENQ